VDTRTAAISGAVLAPADPAGLEGRTIPEVELRELADGQVRAVRARELLGRGTTVLFALPGAFTPTCSNSHVPRFQQLADELHAHGVDRIVCVSVNDPYVMAAWARAEHADKIRFVADADGAFTRELGMLVDRSGAGLGQRSRRYSALVRDGAIVKAFVEPETGDDPYTVSDADTMLRFLDPEARATRAVAMLGREGCPHCARARRMLREHGFAFEEIDLDERVTLQTVRAITGRATVPQVFIDGRRIGGADDLAAWLERDAGQVQGAVEAPTG
jgi:glutaredoxin-like protein